MAGYSEQGRHPARNFRRLHNIASVNAHSIYGSLIHQTQVPSYLNPRSLNSLFTSEFQPILRPNGLSFHWLRTSRARMSNPNPSAADSFVINFDDVGINNNSQQQPSEQESEPSTENANPAGNQFQQNPNNNNNNNEEEAGAAELLRQNPELREQLLAIQKYIPFLVILLSKGAIDHRAGILIFIGLFVTFCRANTVVKREIANQSNHSIGSLLLVVAYLLGCIVFIYYLFGDQKLYLSLVFIPPYSQPLSMWDLFWIVAVTDFVLKLVTIMLKACIAMLPGKILPYAKRGKCFLFVECTSQLYRSLAPIQPWLYYLLESYEGPEKVVGVFLSAAYMVSKSSDLINRCKKWMGSFCKLVQNVNVGSSPSKDQIQTAGSQCPICHDDYDTPVLLQCRHIFCEGCVATWFDREQTCPLCRAKVVDDPSWRDGATTYFAQLY